MSAWELPTALEVSGQMFAIRSDFRVVLDILRHYASPDYEPDEKALICIGILYIDEIPPELYAEAYNQAVSFIDAGITDDGKPKPRTMDWDQDAPIIIPAINKVAGQEIRAMPYLHWWSFVGAYMEIGEGVFSSVLAIRQKKAKRKKLEKHEQEFYRENKSLIDMKQRYSAEEQAEIDRLNEMLK